MHRPPGPGLRRSCAHGKPTHSSVQVQPEESWRPDAQAASITTRTRPLTPSPGRSRPPCSAPVRTALALRPALPSRREPPGGAKLQIPEFRSTAPRKQSHLYAPKDSGLALLTGIQESVVLTPPPGDPHREGSRGNAVLRQTLIRLQTPRAKGGPGCFCFNPHRGHFPWIHLRERRGGGAST